MKKPIIFAVSASLYLSQIVLAQSTSRIQIRKSGETIATVGDLLGQLQVRADKSSSTAKNVTVLKGNVFITVTNSGKVSAHLRADEVLVESDSIEIQVYDYRDEEKMGWVNHLGDTAGEPQAPREAFLRALKAHPQINSFRMQFGVLLGGDGSNTTVLYSRRDKTLKYYESGSENDGRQSHVIRYLYTGVTDKIIQALVQTYARTDAGYTHGHFGFLTKFGAKRVKL